MEFTLTVFSKQGHQEQWREPRRSVRAVADCRMIVGDKAGFTSGQVIDMARGGVDYATRSPSHMGGT
jgi:hypothetical protein